MSWARHEFERISIYTGQISQEVGREVVKELQEQQARAQADKEGYNRPYEEHGLRPREVPNFVFGVVAGLRHCDGAPDGFSEDGLHLYFSDTLKKAMNTSTFWADSGIRVGVNLGSIIDRYVFHASDGSSEVELGICPCDSVGKAKSIRMFWAQSSIYMDFILERRMTGL